MSVSEHNTPPNCAQCGFTAYELDVMDFGPYVGQLICDECWSATEPALESPVSDPAVHDTITEACEHCGHGWGYHVPRCTTCGCMWSPPSPPGPPPKTPTERDLLITRVRAAIYQELDRQHENAEIGAAGYWDSEWGRVDGEPDWARVSGAVIDALSSGGFVVRKRVGL